MNKSATAYPAKHWQTSTPEEQGIDSVKLVEMLEAIRRTEAPVHSVLLIRHGALVMEAYMHPFGPDTRHDLFSATKSFTSTLIGIAIDEGKIKGVDEPVLSFFPNVNAPDNNLGAGGMTIKHLLTMTAGHAEDSVDAVHLSQNWPRDFFRQPFAHAPGQAFLYDSGASHLLSAILERATGMGADRYAGEKLFAPLGISDYSWETSGDGLNTGGWGIRMKPADMARFGYLALNGGNWNGRQLVSSRWLDEATARHVESDWSGSRGDDYGYQWWMNPFGGYRADGFAGQCVYVLPELDVVAVITAGMHGKEEYQPGRLMADFVVPAAQASGSLPANDGANKRLEELLAGFANPAPQAVPPMPEMAGLVSRRKYRSPAVFQEFSLDFSKAGECALNVRQGGRAFSLAVGLDGVHRITKAQNVGTLQWYPPYEAVALKGRWEGGDVFVIEWQYLGEPYRETYTFTFREDSAVMEITEYVTGCAGPMQPHSVYQCGAAAE